jgi:uncharacterized coiled-coil DUF342 family protein
MPNNNGLLIDRVVKAKSYFTQSLFNDIITPLNNMRTFLKGKSQVKQYLKALYASNPKEAKNELAKIVEAMELGKKHDELMNEMMGMADVAKSHYDNMKSETYEEQLKEIEKLHDEMRRLYNDISKLEK